MATNSNQPASSPPPKPWEQVGSASGPVPFKPSSPGSTSDVVDASGTAKPGEIVSAAGRNTTINRNALGRPVPARPWEQQTCGNTYGGYGANLNYNSGFGAGMYGSYGGYGASYGGGLYGNNMYRGTNGLYGGTSTYGGGTFNNGFGGPMGSYRMSMGMGGPFGDQDLNNPHDGSPSPPGFWISILRVMHGVVNFFGRISILIDQNTQAFHMFMTALLQLFDRSGVLYGELARFVLRLLGIKTKPRKIHPQGPEHIQGPSNAQNFIDGPKAALNGGWDSVWRENAGH